MKISKAEMKDILVKMMEKYRLAAPAFNEKNDGSKGVLDFLELKDINNIVMDDRIPYKSPKEFFFPRCEKLFSFREGEVIAGLARDTKNSAVIFGVKPCDLEALDVLAKIFSQGKFADPYIAAHFENHLIIGVGCQEKKPGCFCDRLHVDMKNYSNKCDLFLAIDNDGDYYPAYVSEKGMKAFKYFIPELKAGGHAASLTYDKPLLSLAHDDLQAFETINWESLSETCLACGLCTFICPVCHCFNFKDVDEGGAACRYRIWDSCMFPKFTLHASGHNPRASKTERYRQRVLHKFVYVPQIIGKTACTGCGRCVRSCPAGMDIQKVVEGVAELTNSI